MNDKILLEEKINNLISDFSTNALQSFLEMKNSNFNFYQEDLSQYSKEIPDNIFEKVSMIGDVIFEDKTKFAVFTIKISGQLTERSSKRKQFDLAKKILKGGKFDAGFFVFYDDNKNFRFSFVHSIYKGIKREFSHYKRYTYFVEKGKPYYTFRKSLFELNLDSIESIVDAFNVEKVTEEFFEAYRYVLNEVIIKSLDSNIDYKTKHSFAQQLLSRILFIYFLQRKGWLKWKDYVQDTNYIRNLWRKYKEYIDKNKAKENTFYSSWLSSLFFGAFNNKSCLIDTNLPEDIQESFRTMPFLNGGLFTRNELDEKILNVPDSVFGWLFEPDPNKSDKKKGFLETFNFTIDESSPLDIEVAVDPEMLGKVYESLIAEEERGSIGIFYTPRIEIDLMCRLSLVEYISNNTDIPKEHIIDIVFNPSEISKKLDLEMVKKIKFALDRVKIVDPAVGSASFLVGMMNILVELQFELTRRIYGKDENLFALKQKILLENLYGVDVKDWAVMVGELRLWLSLIIETDEKNMDIYKKPLLPNLSFKIRQGDSLVEEIGGIQIALRGDALKSKRKKVKRRITELIDEKRKFFSSQRSANLKEIERIEKLEQNIFIDILESKIDKIDKMTYSLKKEIPRLKSQKDVFGNLDKKSLQIAEEKERQLKELEAEREKYRRTIENLKNKTQKDYFLWEVDFAEVFAEEGGFDIVIGNPPYVRQELIAPPLENPSNYNDEEWRKLKAQYKEKLISSVKNIWKDVVKIDKKSDLYVYFYFHGLSLLKEDGIFCFINSNSWLDVGYGACLQEFLLKNMQPIYIIDNLKKRSFKQADVNTVIVLIKRPEQKLNDYTVKFITFKKPFEDVINAEIFNKIAKCNKPVFDDEDFRIFPKTKKELLIEGVEIPDEDVGAIHELSLQLNYEHLPYIGNKWGGKYLRAPEIYFKILEKGKGKLVRLGDIAEVKAGIITGNNKKYYTLKTERFDTAVYYPVFKSPRNVNKIILTVNDTKWLIKIKNVPYEIRRAPILWVDLRGDKHICHYNVDDIPFEHNFYGIFGKKIDNETLCLLLNSTLTWFLIEVLGRRGLGGGAIRLVKIDILKLPILDTLDNLKLSMKNFSEFTTRPIHSIFTELGFDPSKPIREQEPNPLPDRKALDDIVFDALGLTEEERKEVYWAVAELVKNRLEKARSV